MLAAHPQRQLGRLGDGELGRGRPPSTVSQSMASDSAWVSSIWVTGSGSVAWIAVVLDRLLAHVVGLEAGPPLEDVGEDHPDAADPVEVLVDRALVADRLDVERRGGVPVGRRLRSPPPLRSMRPPRSASCRPSSARASP